VRTAAVVYAKQVQLFSLQLRLIDENSQQWRLNQKQALAVCFIVLGHIEPTYK